MREHLAVISMLNDKPDREMQQQPQNEWTFKTALDNSLTLQSLNSPPAIPTILDKCKTQHQISRLLLLTALDLESTCGTLKFKLTRQHFDQVNTQFLVQKYKLQTSFRASPELCSTSIWWSVREGQLILPVSLLSFCPKTGWTDSLILRMTHRRSTS